MCIAEFHHNHEHQSNKIKPELVLYEKIKEIKEEEREVSVTDEDDNG